MSLSRRAQNPLHKTLISDKGEDNLKKNRKYVRIGIACAIIIALVLVVPFPLYINFSGPGFRLYSDMSEEPITLTLKGWYWESLVGFSKSVEGQLKITNPADEDLIYRFYSGPLIKIQTLYFLGIYSKSETATIYSKSFDTFIISYQTTKEYFDLASADIGKSGEDILNFFRSYIRFDFN